MAKVTSSSNRSKRSSKKPVTGSKPSNRSNRSRTSTARVTTSGGGGGARVTNASQRTTTGSARVTGTSRPALPPGRQGGALATRPSGRPALPPGRQGGALANRPRGGTGVGAAAVTAVATPFVRAAGTAAGNAIGGFLARQNAKPKEDKRTNRPGGKSSKTSKPKPSASAYEKLYDPQGGRGNYGLDKPKPQKPKPPTSSASASRSSRASSSRASTTTTSRRSTPSRPTASSAPKPPKVAQTSGIGPVKSGDEYARKKGSLREQARKLREMQAESRKRQGK